MLQFLVLLLLNFANIKATYVISDGSVRIVSNYKNCSSGRVEFYKSGTWGSFSNCENLWDSSATDAICEELGFSSGSIYFQSSSFVPYTPSYISYDYVLCDYIYGDICTECTLGSYYGCYNHAYDINVLCYGLSTRSCALYNSTQPSPSTCFGSSGSSSSSSTTTTLSGTTITFIILFPILFCITTVLCILWCCRAACFRKRRAVVGLTYKPLITQSQFTITTTTNTIQSKPQSTITQNQSYLPQSQFQSQPQSQHGLQYNIGPQPYNPSQSYAQRQQQQSSQSYIPQPPYMPRAPYMQQSPQYIPPNPYPQPQPQPQPQPLPPPQYIPQQLPPPQYTPQQNYNQYSNLNEESPSAPLIVPEPYNQQEGQHTQTYM